MINNSTPRPFFFRSGDLCHEKLHKSRDKTNLTQITNGVKVKFVCDESSLRLSDLVAVQGFAMCSAVKPEDKSLAEAEQHVG